MNKKFITIIIVMATVAIAGLIAGVIIAKNNQQMVKINIISPSSIKQEFIEVKKGTKLKDVKAPEKEGYHFKGWAQYAEILDPDFVVNEDIDLYPVYESDEIENVTKYWTVTFENTYLDPVKVKDGAILEKPADPKKDGYTLKEWQLNGIKYNFTEPVTSDLVLTAVWEKIVINNTTTNTNKVNNTNTNNNVAINTNTNTTTNDNELTTYTITFKFNKDDAKVSYNGKQYGNNDKLTVQFSKNDNIHMIFVAKPAKYDITSVLSTTAETEVNGINGFFINGFSSTNVTVNDNAQNTTTRTATVTFTPNNGQASISYEVVLGTHATPPNVSNPGCTLKGWYQYYTLINFNTLEINEPISVHAEWECSGSLV